MKDIKIILSSILIIISFFIWYLFSKEKMKIEIEEIKNKKSVVNLEIKKDKININSSWKDVIVLVNWNEVNSWKIILE